MTVRLPHQFRFEQSGSLSCFGCNSRAIRVLRSRNQGCCNDGKELLRGKHPRNDGRKTPSGLWPSPPNTPVRVCQVRSCCLGGFGGEQGADYHAKGAETEGEDCFGKNTLAISGGTPSGLRPSPPNTPVRICQVRSYCLGGFGGE